MNSFLESRLVGNGETNPDKIYKTWNDIGFLEGLTVEHRRKLSLLYEEGAEKLLANDEYKYNDELGTVFFPCIRRIYSEIAGLNEGYYSKRYKDFPEMQEKAFALFKLEEVLKELNVFTKYFMVFGELYLKNLDHEAELTVLFCDNFQSGIYKQIKKHYEIK